MIEGKLSDDQIEAISKLKNEIFGGEPVPFEKLKYEFDSKNSLLTQLVYHREKLMAFKTGYEKKHGGFYSWLGGVLPEYRGKDVAAELMKLQHANLKEKGYRYVETRTGNEYKGMLILNIKSGFEIVGTLINSSGNFRIIMQKSL